MTLKCSLSFSLPSLLILNNFVFGRFEVYPTRFAFFFFLAAWKPWRKRKCLNAAWEDALPPVSCLGWTWLTFITLSILPKMMFLTVKKSLGGGGTTLVLLFIDTYRRTQPHTNCFVPVPGYVSLLWRSLNTQKKRHTLLLLLIMMMMMMLVVVVVTNPKTMRYPSQNWKTTLVVAIADPRWKMRSVSSEVFVKLHDGLMAAVAVQLSS